jgi:hypothetical protein
MLPLLAFITNAHAAPACEFISSISVNISFDLDSCADYYDLEVAPPGAQVSASGAFWKNIEETLLKLQQIRIAARLTPRDP